MIAMTMEVCSALRDQVRVLLRELVRHQLLLLHFKQDSRECSAIQVMPNRMRADCLAQHQHELLQ